MSLSVYMSSNQQIAPADTPARITPRSYADKMRGKSPFSRQFFQHKQRIAPAHVDQIRLFELFFDVGAVHFPVHRQGDIRLDVENRCVDLAEGIEIRQGIVARRAQKQPVSPPAARALLRQRGDIFVDFQRRFALQFAAADGNDPLQDSTPARSNSAAISSSRSAVRQLFSNCSSTLACLTAPVANAMFRTQARTPRAA